MTDPAGAPSRRADRRDLLPFQLLMGVTAGGIGGIVTVLGVVRDEFGFSGLGIGLKVGSGFVAAFVSQVTLARLADGGHARAMATAGIALSAAAMLAMVFAVGLGAAEVAGAAISALPAAWLYESRGPGPIWALVGLAVLALVVVGWLRIRGTVPASGPQAPRFDALS